MADEPKRPARSSSTGGGSKSRTRSTRAKAASSEASTAAETPKAAPSEAPKEAKAEPPKAAPTPTPTPTPAPAAPQPVVAAEASGSGSGVALAGLFAGIIGVVLALTYPFWTPVVYGEPGAKKGVTAAQVQGEVETLKKTIAAMTEKQAALEQTVQTAKLPGILMVAGDLRSALGGSEPYAGLLNLFRALTGNDKGAAPIITAIESRAELGVPTTVDLRTRFDDVVHAILTAEEKPEAHGNLAAQVSDTVASLTAATMRLQWRLNGVPTGDGVPAIVARAEQAVMAGELQTAIDTLGTLPPERAALAGSWIELAKARMSANTVREDLDAYIIARAARIQ